MEVVTNKAQMFRLCQKVARPLGLVPTMGYIHQGHLSLVQKARSENKTLTVSIFVNPTQFGPQEDFATYPRDMEQDLKLLAKESTDLVFAPAAEEIYPPGFDAWVEAGKIAQRLEGECRPGHFQGVVTVVSKLFNIVRPDRAYFGQKDGQQVAVIKHIAADLDMGVEVVVSPTVREPDGLAMSSRNMYLTAEQRRVAPVIFKALCRAGKRWQEGERSGECLRREVRLILEAEPLIEKIDYVSVADATILEELEHVEGPAMVSVAVRIGKARLIDNVVLGE